MAEVKQPKINERVKIFRLSLNLKQGEFAQKIGIRQSSLSDIENIRVNVSDRVIKDICLSFSANEFWLRTGEGEMVNESKDSTLAQVTDLLKLDDTEQQFLSAYLNLSYEQRQNLKESICNYIHSYNSLETAPVAATTDAQVTKNTSNRITTDEGIEEELASYRAELIAEQKGQSALQNFQNRKKA